MIKKYLNKLAAFLLAGFVLVGLSACQQADKKVTLTYSAAASLQTTLTQIGKNYEKAHPNVTINFDFAGSGTIREKVLAGAPIDGVFLASQSDITKLGKKVTASKAVLGNSLVLIAPVKTALASDDLSSLLNKAHTIAIGEPGTVPAGMYAQESLIKLGLWTAVQPKLVQASDVTQVLSYVSSGNADLGFVYQTDALTTDKVKVLETIPASDHEAIRYYTATVASSQNKIAVEDFNRYLTDSSAQKIFTQAGFTKAN